MQTKIWSHLLYLYDTVRKGSIVSHDMHAVFYNIESEWPQRALKFEVSETSSWNYISVTSPNYCHTAIVEDRDL